MNTTPSPNNPSKDPTEPVETSDEPGGPDGLPEPSDDPDKQYKEPGEA